MNTILAVLLLTGIQDQPQDIAKKDLPKKVECVICTAKGAGHDAEKPVAGVRYKGTSYFFCHAGEVAGFKKDPEAFLPPVLPRAMAAFDLTDRSGKTWDAKAFEGRLVMVDFWATWCGPCKEIKPRLDALRKKHGERGFEVLSVSIDEKKDVLEKFLKKNRFENPVLHDTTQTWAVWKVRNVPTLFLVKDGQIVGQWVGVPKKGVVEAAVAANL